MPNTSTNGGINRSLEKRSNKPRSKTEPNSKTSSLTSINESQKTPSKIPVYSVNNKRLGSFEQLKQSSNLQPRGGKHSLSAHQLSDLPEEVKLMHMVHCHCNHSPSSNMPRSQTHEFNCKRGSSIASTSSTSTPGTFTPRVRKPSTDASSSVQSNGKGRNKGNPALKTARNYEEYLPLCEMQRGLEKGEIVEGILRINPKNYNDAYISAPEGGLDIFIGGLYDRNRALNGDQVAVKLNDVDKWTMSASSINSNWNEWKEEFQKLIEAKVAAHALESFQITHENLKMLNGQDYKKVDISSKSQNNKAETLGDTVLKEFPNVPLAVYLMSISELQKLSFSSKFIQRSGKVVFIKTQNHSRIVGGTILVQNNCKAKMITSDNRVPHVMIPFNTLPKDFVNNYDLMKDNLFLVQITDWTVSSLFPKGKIVDSLGKSGELESEIAVLLRSYDIDTSDFPEEALQEYDLFSSESWKIPEKEFTYRRDFRQECVFTIDPQSARDLDDAISVKKVSSDVYEVGVHIADVSYFIQEKTILDLIAKKRATSVYMPNKVIPMLPHLFCQNLCSLNPGQDKLTFSVVFTMDAEGNVTDKWIGRTVINSCAKLSYEHAQKMIETEDDQILVDDEFPQLHNDWPLSFVAAQVKQVNQIAQAIRMRRFASGSLRLDKTKLGFMLNEEGMPVSFSKYVYKDSNRLIEELMLLANKAVAEHLFKHFAHEDRAFLRGHPPPNLYNMNEFVAFCKSTSIPFDISNSLSIYSSLQQLLEQNPLYFRLCSMNLIKSMKLAFYTCVSAKQSPKSYHHYALNFDKYTHFTSPIRRYADVIVHRLLCSSLGYESICSKSPSELAAIAENCNLRKYNAFIVSERSSEIYLKVYISSIGCFTSRAIVCNVYDHSFDVLILKFDIVNRVYLDQLPLQSFEFIKTEDDPRLKLKWNPAPIGENSGEETKSLEQTIFNLLELDIKMSVDDKFNFSLLIAHPCGDFIGLNKMNSQEKIEKPQSAEEALLENEPFPAETAAVQAS